MVEIPHHPSRSAPMQTLKPASVFIDIESIRSQELWVKEYVAETVKPPGNMKKAETIAKWEIEEKASAIDEAMEKCVFDGAMNHIICIGVAIDDHAPVAFQAADPRNEKDILAEFFDYLAGNVGQWGVNNRYVGHNISGFDLRVIKQRSMILGIRPPAWIPFDNKPWDKNPYDTMMQWDQRNPIKLDKLARAFGIEGKSMDGSKVYEMWKSGLMEQIVAYCKCDVEMVRKVYKRMTFEA